MPEAVTARRYVARVLCLACTAPTPDRLCSRCARELRSPPDTLLPSGQLVIGAYTHEGAARLLVHALKYRGLSVAAEGFAAELAIRVPVSTTALVPVPRALSRSIRYGIDPAAVLARAVSRKTGITVIHALGAPLWWRSHAGASRPKRLRIRFRQRLAVPRGAALVDDVVTTGTTAAAAADALGGLPALVLAATVASKIRSGESPSGGRVTGAPASGTNDRTDPRVPPPNGVFDAPGDGS